jgi:hypothetical protein
VVEIKELSEAVLLVPVPALALGRARGVDRTLGPEPDRRGVLRELERELDLEDARSASITR